MTLATGLPGQKPQAEPRAEDVTPERTAGTPREWLLMALVEARLEHRDAATAWRNKAVRWLDRAKTDRADPEVLGTMSSPADRMMFRIQQAPLSMGIRYDSNRMKRFQPTWRQILELDLLWEEADRAGPPKRLPPPGSP